MTVHITRDVRAPAAAIWALWEDVEGSPRWDPDVVWSRLAGPFCAGTRGELLLKSGLRATLQLTTVQPQRAYHNTLFLLPGVHILLGHTLEPLANEQTRVLHSAHVEGPLGRLQRPALERLLRGAMSRALDQLKALAEEGEVPVVNAVEARAA